MRNFIFYLAAAVLALAGVFVGAWLLDDAPEPDERFMSTNWSE